MLRRALLIILGLNLGLNSIVAMAQGADSVPPASPQQERATAAIREYLARRVERLAAHEPANAATLAEWERLRPTLRRQLFDMLGLWPIPEKQDLRAASAGQVERDGVVVEKLHFQSLPGLYVTANFYRPREMSGKLPVILYLNGHARSVEKGVSFGNKTPYQHHGCWFARNGYCCLTIDTLQLGEIEGDHHGTYRLGQWWWIARGYTPAGVEAWNSIRALDYLETRPEVDMSKVGVTGRSGGGAYSWWVAALDDRPACVVPVAGITDLEDHVVHDCVQGHCDCMYHVNRLGWDFGTVAALVAPRPCLLANTDKDTIFPLGGVTRIHERLRHVYGLYGAADKLGLFITEGPHADTQELQLAAFRWMNRWLRGTVEPITVPGDKPFPPAELKVFAELPGDQRNTSIQETFVPAAMPGAPPATLSSWNSKREKLLAALRDRCFGGIVPGERLDVRVVEDQTAGPTRLRVVEYASDEGLRLPLFVLTALGEAPLERVRVEVAGDETWQRSQPQLVPFANQLAAYGLGNVSETSPNRPTPPTAGEAIVILPPRGWGPNAWLADVKSQTHLPRRFYLTGTTVDEGRIYDVRRGIAVVREILAPDAKITLAGRGPAAGIALYAAVLEPGIDELELQDLAASHRTGPILIDVLRVLDLPQAVALVFPRPVKLATSDAAIWNWTESVAKLYGDPIPLRLETVATEAAAR